MNRRQFLAGAIGAGALVASSCLKLFKSALFQPGRAGEGLRRNRAGRVTRRFADREKVTSGALDVYGGKHGAYPARFARNARNAGPSATPGYPGRIKPLNRNQIARISQWSG